MTKVKVVIGANYGDEGKGLMTDYFTAKANHFHEKCLVVCSNGGSQRGHTVVTPDGRRHIFHHLGSGTFQKADTYLSEEYILNPIVFQKEYKVFIRYQELPVLYVNKNCRWSTPFDMMMNQIVEESRGKKRHGSCGIGIWETVVRYRSGAVGLGEAMKMRDNELFTYLKQIRDTYLPYRLREQGVEYLSREWEAIIGDENLLQAFVQDFRFMTANMTLAEDEILKEYDTVIFENGQGLLLDRNMEENKAHTTPSNTGLENPRNIIKTVFKDRAVDVEVCYVTRTYLTRHGAGPFETECKKEEINAQMIDKTNVPNPHQGVLRYGWLVPDQLKERIEKDFGQETGWKMSLAITHVNEYGVLPDIKLPFVNRYLSDGETRESVRKTP